MTVRLSISRVQQHSPPLQPSRHGQQRCQVCSRRLCQPAAGQVVAPRPLRLPFGGLRGRMQQDAHRQPP